jgi:hypothetical protein
VPNGCLTIDRLNAGVQVDYSVTYQCSSSCSTTRTESLDGIELDVTWIPPATGGGLATQSGCLTQTPYYSPDDHSPAYDGACALLRVSRSTTNPDGNRIVALWGTVYAPSAALDVQVDILTVPVFNRGVVARMLMLGYEIENDAIVPITTTPSVGTLQNRRMTLSAQVPGTTTRVVADVETCDVAACGTTPQGRVKVHSWTVER